MSRSQGHISKCHVHKVTFQNVCRCCSVLSTHAFVTNILYNLSVILYQLILTFLTINVHILFPHKPMVILRLRRFCHKNMVSLCESLRYMYVCTYVYMYVCMYVCMYACMYVCMYVLCTMKKAYFTADSIDAQTGIE